MQQSLASPRSGGALLCCLVLSCALLACAEGQAQASASFTTFGGNEWWVEVYVDSASPLASVDVSVDGAAARPLTLQGWGAWAASFFVPEGSSLLFRAHTVDGQIASSPIYLWPSGQVIAEAPSPDQPPVADEGSSAFSAVFRNVRGNSWWVEGVVESDDVIASVDARENGGVWMPLSRTGWGSWAASFFVADGSLVELRATSSSGAIALSALYSWPDGAVVDAPSPTPPPDDVPPPEEPLATPLEDGDPLIATFEDVRGNEWWIEAEVNANAAITSVHARVNGVTMTALARTGWGSWAASFHVPAGSLVELRATAESGASAWSAAYRWPDATPTTSPEEPPTIPPPPPAGEPETDVVALDDPRVRFLGRVDDRAAGQPACSWTGCGFVVVTDASAIDLEVEAQLFSGNADYLRVQIDDDVEDVISLSGGVQRVRLASGLSSGPHTISIFKRTEGQVGTVSFRALELENGRLLDAPALSGPRLLVVGDSNTAGYGNVGEGPFCPFSAATEDGWQTYGNLAAQRLGGEAVITAYSGKGVYRNRAVSDPWVMPLLFDRLDVTDSASQAPFDPVDIVIVNLGQNDFSSGTPARAAFVDAYVAFAGDLRQRFANAPILLALTPTMSDDWPAGEQQRSTLRSYLQDVVTARAAAGDPDVHLWEPAPLSDAEPFGCDYHPHVVTHERMADELVAEIGRLTAFTPVP